MVRQRGALPPLPRETGEGCSNVPSPNELSDGWGFNQDFSPELGFPRVWKQLVSRRLALFIETPKEERLLGNAGALDVTERACADCWLVAE